MWGARLECSLHSGAIVIVDGACAAPIPVFHGVHGNNNVYACVSPYAYDSEVNGGTGRWEVHHDRQWRVLTEVLGTHFLGVLSILTEKKNVDVHGPFGESPPRPTSVGKLISVL